MRVITNADGTSLREGPGLDFDVVSPVAQGERLQVLEGPTTNDRIIWYEVQGASLTGWIAGNLLSPDPDPTAPLPPPEPTPPAEEEASPPPATLDEAPVTDATGDGTAVGGGGEEDGGRRARRRRERRQEAWPIFEAGTVAMVMDGALNLRAEPGLWAPILDEMPDGFVVTVIDGPVDGEGIAWYQVLTPENAVGWCDGTYLQPV
jgi:uncharacterized protein YgiM (DUF1202 family)